MPVSQKHIDRIIERQEHLKSVGEELKLHFVGIDNVIDKIIRNIEVWYVMPELMNRPLIVNLWGMTGVGKTDLVRRLVRLLNLNDSFLEVQMSNQGCSMHPMASSLHSILLGSSVEPHNPGVLLLDEIQRFRTVDEDGHELRDGKLQDIWMLLSDGKFSADGEIKEELYRMLMRIHYDRDTRKNGGEDEEYPMGEGEPDNKKRKYKQSYWGAVTLKNTCRLTEPIEKIMQWDADKQLSVIEKSLKSQEVYEGDCYSKLLIFVSGNIDEAYEMSGLSDEADIDADLFHQHSLRINMISIKKALSKRFKPEQIARLGNSHIIYPSLSKASYKEIIQRKIVESTKRISDEFGVNVNVHPSVNEAIYRNGVFPVQGTRPLFSTINSFYEPLLPKFVLRALLNKIDDIEVYYEDKHLCAKIGDDHYRQPNEGELDAIKLTKHNDNKHVATCIHEAGHAVAYAILFGLAPTQIAVSVTSNDSEGFVGLHDMSFTKPMIEKAIAVYLAGRAAEEHAFGPNIGKGAGAQGDIKQATSLASKYARDYGMNELAYINFPANSCAGAIECFTEYENSNETIKTLLDNAYYNVCNLITHNKKLIEEVSRLLIGKKALSPVEFTEILNKYGYEIDIIDARETVYEEYVKAFEKNHKLPLVIGKENGYNHVYGGEHRSKVSARPVHGQPMKPLKRR